MSRDGWLYLTSPEDTGQAGRASARNGHRRSAAQLANLAEGPDGSITSLRRDCKKCRGFRKRRERITDQIVALST
jgi:hypothetical protein